MQNIRTVQALTLESRFYDRFCDFLKLPFETRRYRAFFQSVSYGYASLGFLSFRILVFRFASSIFYFLHAAAFGFGVYLIINHNNQPMSVLRTLFAISFTAGSMGYVPINRIKSFQLTKNQQTPKSRLFEPNRKANN